MREAIGAEILRRREAAGMSRAKVAAAAGCSAQAVYYAERGICGRLELLIDILEVVGGGLVVVDKAA